MAQHGNLTGNYSSMIAVTPAHVYMLQRPELFGVPYWALVLRIPLQVALLALIVWSCVLPVSPGRKPG